MADKSRGHIDQELLPLVEIARFGEPWHDQLMRRVAHLPMTNLGYVRKHTMIYDEQ
jgi:hypothetical protein